MSSSPRPLSAPTTLFARHSRAISHQSRAFSLLIVLLAMLLAAPAARAGEMQLSPEEEVAARRTAVALNYCRSAFYRIRQNPSEAVLAEERQKILNNLDLTAIQDEQVVELYSSTLDEISNIRIADKEHTVVSKSYGKSWKSLATVTAFGFLTDLSEFNYATMVRRGATSWWDFRGIQVNRDMDLWKVEKERLNTIQTKSSSFLEASWKLAHSRHVPDRWLVRDSEFERLQRALQESDLKVRLRLLQRLAPFMECYPPYWYYKGRTQQQLGEFAEAEQTYVRAADLGDGHFRRDEMLAAAMANVASIRDYLDLPGAPDAARKALAYTTDAPEVNLAAAAVLMRNGRIAQAEDAVLRNLDTGIETEQSEVALLAVYAREGEPSKILARLDDPALVNRTPIPILLRCAAQLEGKTLPRAVASRLQSSLQAYVQDEHLVLAADPAWRLGSAKFAVDEAMHARPQMQVTERRVTVRIPKPMESSEAMSTETMTVKLQYDSDFTITLALRTAPPTTTAPRNSNRWGRLLPFVAERNPRAPIQPAMSIASIETAGTRIALSGPIRDISSGAGASETGATIANITPAVVPLWQGVSIEPVAYDAARETSPSSVSSDARGSEEDMSESEMTPGGVTLGRPEPVVEVLP